MQVNGRYLYNTCGEAVVMRGAGVMTLYWDGYGPTNGDDWSEAGEKTFTELEKSGANAARIFWHYEHGSLGWRIPAEALDYTVTNSINHNIIPMVGLWEATGDQPKATFDKIVDYWTSPDIVAVIKKHEDYFILNIANEWNAGTDAQIRSAYSEAITRIRNAGIKVPIVIDGGRRYTQDESAVFNNSQYLIDHDPESNLIFSMHMYDPEFWACCDPDGTKARFKNIMDTAVQQDICFIWGEFAQEGHDGTPVAWEYIMEYSDQQDIGWFAWIWWCCSGDGDSKTLARDKEYGRFMNQPYGREVVLGQFGIQNTAVRHNCGQISQGVVGGNPDTSGNPTVGTGKTEAETLRLSNMSTINDGRTYVQANVETGNFESGSAWFTFGGSTDLYTIKVAYLDEDDGQTTWRLYVGGEPKLEWTGTADDNQWKVFTGTVQINQGQEVGLEVVLDRGSLGRIDYLELTPGATDTTPPTVPSGLNTSSVQETSVALSWTASTDNVAVTGYQIFANGTLVKTTSGTATTVTGLTGGTSYALTVAATDAVGNTSLPSSAINTITTGNSFQQSAGSDGLVAMEAENYNANVPGVNAFADISWQKLGDPAASNDQYMVVPNNGANNTSASTNAPNLNYRVSFMKSEATYLWMRVIGANANDDSVIPGYNGTVISQWGVGAATSWTWVQSPVTFTPAVGEQTFSLYMREDGLRVDKIVLTTSSTYTPTGEGPPQSPKDGTSLNPPTAPTLAAIVAQGSSQAVLSWSDNSNNESGFRVERKTNGAFSVIATLSANATAYTDSGLGNGIAYTYRVVAFNADGSGASASQALTIGGVEVTSVSVSPPSANINVGQTLTLTATVSPADATDPSVSWSSNNAVASVDAAGKVTALSAGSAQITATTSNGTSASSSITVTDNNPPPPSGGYPLTLEAENFTSKNSGTGSFAALNWQTQSNAAASGTLYIAVPDNGDNAGSVLAGPRVNYAINVPATGKHYLWARVIALTAGDDSCIPAINGSSVGNWYIGTTSSWTWKKLTIQSISAGSHTLSIFMREDGLKIDKLELTNDGGYTPSGLGSLARTASRSLKPALDNNLAPSSGDVTVYPNPSTGEVYAKAPVNTLITVYNAVGQQVALEKVTSSEATLQLGHLPKGVYTLRSSVPGRIIFKKLILK